MDCHVVLDVVGVRLNLRHQHFYEQERNEDDCGICCDATLAEQNNKPGGHLVQENGRQLCHDPDEPFQYLQKRSAYSGERRQLERFRSSYVSIISATSTFSYTLWNSKDAVEAHLLHLNGDQALYQHFISSSDAAEGSHIFPIISLAISSFREIGTAG